MCNLKCIEGRIKIWCDSKQISKPYKIENKIVENAELPKSLIQSLYKMSKEDILPRSLFPIQAMDILI